MWSGGGPRRMRAVQQQVELLAHPVLGDELGQPPRPQRRLRSRSSRSAYGLRPGRSRHRRPPPGGTSCTEVCTGVTAGSAPAATAREQHRHGRLAVDASGATAATAWSACPRRPAEPDQRLARPGPARAPPAVTPGRPRPARATGPILSRSSSTSRSAPFLPMPGTRVSAGESAVAIARRTSVGGMHREHRLGQPRADPAGRLQQLEQLIARRRRRSRTGSASPPGPPGWWPAGPAGRPAAGPACPGCRSTARPTPPTSTTAPSGADRGDRAAHAGDHRAPPRASGGGQPGLVPAPPEWQIASASASAASAGRGRVGQPQQPGHHRRHLRLVGPAGAGHGRLDLARGVQRDRQRRPGRRPARRPPRPARCPSPCGRCAG